MEINIKMGIIIKMDIISEKNKCSSPISKLGIKIKDNGAAKRRKIIIPQTRQKMNMRKIMDG